jgi:prolyl-tRNA editing enzyme YbaK/EbsC (Cys-tRNA(Pro) deacylase)
LAYDTIAVSGGRRGLQLELAPKVILEVTAGTTADIAED